MDKYVGKRLDGRYEIKEIIGVGGMAYVYKAYDTIDDRIVAVKILKDEFLANEEFTRRFKNESKAIAILSHPNIVKVYDVSFGERIQYIVMEYIDGITLKEYIDQQKDIKWKEAVHFTVQILRALQHAHDKGIVHRDIKPQNIMLLPDGTIKVTDFGIARFARNDMRVTSAADKAIGSVHYISPEQARGDITDERADIYSVGVMLYEMLTGRLPFEADNAVSIAIMQMQAEPVNPREVNPDIPEGLEEITIKAMQKDSSKRYQSAAEMLYDIDEFKRNPSIHFAYKYFVDETPTRFVEAITKVKGNEAEEEHSEEETSQNDEKKKPSVIPILGGIALALVVVFILLASVAAILKITNNNKKNDVDIPNFVGQNYLDVMNDPDLKDKFDYQKVEQTSEDVPANVIIDQTPSYPRKVKEHSTVTLKISIGPQMVEVPSFSKNENQSAVKQRLEDAGFKVSEPIMESSDTVAKDCVIKLSPASGEKLAKGSKVTMHVSNGPEPVPDQAVPNVEKATLESATDTLKSKGFTVGTVTKEFSELPENFVISQDPKAGSSQKAGTSVNLVVSNGFRMVEIPLSIPETKNPVDVEVRVDGEVNKEYSRTNIQNPPVQKLKFKQEKELYTVTINIKSTSDSQYQPYLKYIVHGRDGTTEMTQYPFTEKTSAAEKTTSSSVNTMF